MTSFITCVIVYLTITFGIAMFYDLNHRRLSKYGRGDPKYFGLWWGWLLIILFPLIYLAIFIRDLLDKLKRK